MPLHKVSNNGRINYRPVASNFARVSFFTRCFGTPSTAVIYGRLISVSVEEDKFHLCFFRSFFQTLQSHRIFTQVDRFIFFEFICQPVHDHFIKVITTQVRITIGGFYFKYTITQFQTEISKVPPPRSNTAIF